MSLIPQSVKQEVQMEEISEELESIIQNYFGHKLGDGVNKYSDLKPGDKIEFDDKTTIVVGLALRLTEKEIIVILNHRRKEKGLDPVNIKTLSYYRKKYAEIIDEIYIEATLRIGSIYKFSDKLYRISRYNELATMLRNVSVQSLKFGIDDDGLKVINLYIRTLDRLNVEMGSKSLGDMIRRPLPDDENLPKTLSSKEEAKEALAELLDDRFAGQLPEHISQKMEFTDYENCAFGEKMGEIHVCWNDKITENNRGTQCHIQSGQIRKCPKFLNKTLIDNVIWLKNCRDEDITIRKIALLAGCTEFDEEVGLKINHFFHKYGIRGGKPNTPSKYRERTSESESGGDSITQEIPQTS